jgi:acetyl esterase/lipase
LGWRTHVIEYRRIPGNPDATIDDIKHALDAIGNCVVIGHSAGGKLTALLQAHIQAAGAVLKELKRGSKQVKIESA